MAMKMTHISKTLLSIVCTLWGMSACSDDYNKYDDCPACNYYPVAVGNSTGTPVHAIGVEMDPHFFSQNITRNDGSKAEDWENIVVQRVKKMKVQQFRIMMQPQWWEPSNDNNDPNVADMSKFTFDSEEMQSVYKVLDLAQENNIGVTLVVWGSIAGIDNYEEFAENFSTMVKYLIEEKHYTCINQITPFNEPDSHIAGYGRIMWQGDFETMGWQDTYAPMVKALDAKFKADGIRSKVHFNLSDNTDGTPGYIAACVSAFTNDEADLYNSHVYKFDYNTPNSTLVNWERQNIASAGGQYYNRNASYSEMQQLGLWKYLKSAYTEDPDVYSKIKEDYEVRPQYYAYSLLTRFVRQGDEVYPLDLGDELIAGSAFLNTEGKWTYVLSNATDKDKMIQLENDKEGANGEYNVYKYMEGRLPEGDNLIESTETVNTQENNLKLKLSRSSIRVLVQK